MFNWHNKHLDWFYRIYHTTVWWKCQQTLLFSLPEYANRRLWIFFAPRDWQTAGGGDKMEKIQLTIKALTKRTWATVSQRGGVWCEPLKHNLKFVASEPGGRKHLASRTSPWLPRKLHRGCLTPKRGDIYISQFEWYRGSILWLVSKHISFGAGFFACPEN